jgi:hypothetical protein
MTRTIWLAMSSLRTTAILAIALASIVGVATVVPQGWTAIELARLPQAQSIQTMVALGFTDIFTSGWFRGAFVLIAVNVTAVLARLVLRSSPPELHDPPRGAPLSASLKASLPERAVEHLRETFRGVLSGSPIAERVDGSKVTMVFDTARRAELSPLFAHVGLIVLVVGAGLTVRPAPKGRSVVRALLDVTDSRTGTTGHFDIVSGEPFQFFQWQNRYILRDYDVDRDGLGPAVRVEVFDRGQPITEFWIYQNAPPGFDARHRRDVVSIEARRMGYVPLPGAGLASEPASFLLLAGLGLLAVGALAGRKPRGRVWLEADGDEVRIVGVPHHAEDEGFAAAFRRWEVLARAAVAE